MNKNLGNMKTEEDLIKIHKELHTSLDKLVACYITVQKKGLRDTTVMELIEWSHEQTKKPACLNLD